MKSIMSKSMGRSSKQQAEANRALIVEKASALFRAHGIADVSIGDIMKAVGMTPGGFYKHFDSKESLIHEAACLAFDSSTTSWENISAGQNENHQQHIARHYFSPKETAKRCPMLAFGGDVMKGDNPLLMNDYTDGVNALFRVFAPSAGNDENNRRNLALFAAMVGANYLAELSSDPELSARLRESVLELL